ncbi:MAG: hypothetical protein LBL84_03615 [Candidatus Nomurabacteria bacterium]|jgi:hypothetical protein|nr:hypothetical protein [Candidatus Nomurabacteria bacterium]
MALDLLADGSHERLESIRLNKKEFDDQAEHRATVSTVFTESKTYKFSLRPDGKYDFLMKGQDTKAENIGTVDLLVYAPIDQSGVTPEQNTAIKEALSGKSGKYQAALLQKLPEGQIQRVTKPSDIVDADQDLQLSVLDVSGDKPQKVWRQLVSVNPARKDRITAINFGEDGVIREGLANFDRVRKIDGEEVIKGEVESPYEVDRVRFQVDASPYYDGKRDAEVWEERAYARGSDIKLGRQADGLYKVEDIYGVDKPSQYKVLFVSEKFIKKHSLDIDAIQPGSSSPSHRIKYGYLGDNGIFYAFSDLVPDDGSRKTFLRIAEPDVNGQTKYELIPYNGETETPQLGKIPLCIDLADTRRHLIGGPVAAIYRKAA